MVLCILVVGGGDDDLLYHQSIFWLVLPHN